MRARAVKTLTIDDPSAPPDDGFVTVAELADRLRESGWDVVESTFTDVANRKGENFDCVVMHGRTFHRWRERTDSERIAARAEHQALVYAVSHDLRQPLRSVNGFSQILLDEYGPQLDPKALHYLERVRAGAMRMAEMLEGLLAFSRLGSQSLRSKVLRIDELAHAVRSRLEQRYLDQEVEVAIEPRLEEVGDPYLIELLLEQLMDNAWKFTATRMTARIEIGSRRDGETVYFVRDNGIGFDMNDGARLFAPFQRLHRDEEYPGRGMGLATAQRIVHRHGGRIWAEAAPDRGATFCFTLAPDGGEHHE